MSAPNSYCVWFKDVDRDDVPLVGGKGANLGEMTKAGFPVPQGFIVTSRAYYEFISHNHLRKKITDLLMGLDVSETTELTRVSEQIRKLINQSPVPEEVSGSILKAYDKLGLKTLVAVRSSATAEDLPDASFAGQQETYLNVVGEANLINHVRDAWSSLFTPRALFYRQQKGFDHFKVGIAVPIQRMVQSDISGVMFTINPINNDKSIVVIEAIFGLGELIVQGSVTPDHYEVLKRNLEIVTKQINGQHRQMLKTISDYEVTNKIVAVPSSKQKSQKLGDSLILEVAKLGMKLQEHYYFPQDVEWAVQRGKVFLTQTRPITTIDRITLTAIQSKDATKGLEKLLSGDPASPGLVSGPAKVIRSISDIHRVKPGDVLVMEMTTPDFVPAMKKTVAIVTDKGGQTSHAAIVSRELGITCVVGTQIATRKIRTGMVITVNGTTGEVFRGAVSQKADLQTEDVASKPKPTNSVLLDTLKTATELYVNLAEPELAERVAAENVDGVGLLRAEFMIAQIGIHPKKAIKDRKSRAFITQLADGLGTFAGAFYPRPVVYRATDFRTNEYRNLKGGQAFEPQEPNPMLGFRGAFRYIKDASAFELELEAIKTVRSRFQNLHLMIPFVRSVAELLDVKKIIYSKGLRRGQSFHLWMMAELPVNVISIDEFIKAGIDGISIGSNDLTMLTLGTDRDNQSVTSEYNELDPAVLWSLNRLITAASAHGITSSICGQAPSLYPELTRSLVEWGITSISVAPDRISETRRLIYEAESRNISKNRHP